VLHKPNQLSALGVMGKEALMWAFVIYVFWDSIDPDSKIESTRNHMTPASEKK